MSGMIQNVARRYAAVAGAALVGFMAGTVDAKLKEFASPEDYFIASEPDATGMIRPANTGAWRRHLHRYAV
jgi:hypothetical protein